MLHTTRYRIHLMHVYILISLIKAEPGLTRQSCRQSKDTSESKFQCQRHLQAELKILCHADGSKDG